MLSETTEKKGVSRKSVDLGWLSVVAIPVSAVLAVTGVIAVVQSSGLTRMTTTMLINLVFVVGLYIFSGTTGVLSFGHLGFAAIAAYVSALLTIPSQQKGVLLPDLPAVLANADVAGPLALIAAVAVATVCAGLVAVPLMRLSGLAAAIATFSVLQIVFVVSKNWESVAGAAGVMLGVPLTTSMTTALVCGVIAVVVAGIFQESRMGLRLRASREDEPAARASGVHVTRDRIYAFTISGAIVALGGVLFGHYLGAFAPNDFYLGPTFIVFAMLVIGGMTSLAGAALGVLVVSGLTEALLRVEQATGLRSLREIGLGLVMLGILLWYPRGITQGREIRISMAGLMNGAARLKARKGHA